MAIFPVIQSPCPYKGRLTDILDGDVCRLCDKQVHDLSAMSDEQKRAFFRSCPDDVCVSYRLPAALASATMLAALGVAAPSASAQEAAQPARAAQSGETYDRIIVGGATLIPRTIAVGPARTRISVRRYELLDLIPGRKPHVCKEHDDGEAHQHSDKDRG